MNGGPATLEFLVWVQETLSSKGGTYERRKIHFLSVLMTVVLGVLFALNAAYAFEPGLAKDKWFKVTFEINGFCDIFLGELEKGKRENK